jgi:hypothetical protein
VTNSTVVASKQKFVPCWRSRMGNKLAWFARSWYASAARPAY